MDETGVHLIQFDHTFKEAKYYWNSLCESSYLARIFSTSEGNLSTASRMCSVDRKHLRTLLRKYKIDFLTSFQYPTFPWIDYTQTFKKAKRAWIEQFEISYLTRAHATWNTPGLIARNTGIDRTHVRMLLDHYNIRKITHPKPTMRTVVHPEKFGKQKLLTRFYNGIEFERGFAVYLFLKGKPPERQDIERIIQFLYRYRVWDSLRTALIAVNMLVVVRHHWNWNEYAWNEAILPNEWKQGLARVLAGEKIECVLNTYLISL